MRRRWGRVEVVELISFEMRWSEGRTSDAIVFGDKTLAFAILRRQHSGMKVRKCI